MIRAISFTLLIGINLYIPLSFLEIKADNLSEILIKGEDKHFKKDFYGAIEEFNKLIEKNPKKWEAYHNRGLSKRGIKDLNGAIIDFTKAIELNPIPWFRSFEFRGITKYELGNTLGAIEDYSEVLKINPNYQNGYYSRALLKEIINDYEGAILDYSEALRIDKNDKDSYLNRANIKDITGDKYGALEDYSKAIILDPKNSNAYFNRAYIKKENKDFKGALEDFLIVINLNPLDSGAFFNIALLKERVNEYESALQYYSKAIKIEDDNSDFYLFRAGIKSKLKDFNGAIEDYSKAIILNPKDYIAYERRGLVKKKIEDFEGAISDFSNAININKKQSSQSFINRGYSKQMISDHEGAISDFNIAINLEPKYYYSYYARADSKGKLGNYDEAIKDLNLAIKINPKDKFSLGLRGYYKSILNDFEGAISDQTLAINIDPKYSYAYHSRGFSKARLGDLDGAVLDLESVFNFGNIDDKFLSISYLIDVYTQFAFYKDIPELIQKGKRLLSQTNKAEANLAIIYLESIYNLNIGNLAKSEELSKNCLEKIKLEKINDSIFENYCTSLLSNIYINNGKFKKAKEFIKFRTLEGQLSLAYIAFMEQKLQKAERILTRIYKIQFKDSNFKKPDPYISSMIGSALWFQGKNKEAKIFHRESLNIYKSIYGENNPILIQPYINLAMVYFNENDFENTEIYLRKSLNLQFKFIQEQIPYIPLSKREEFIKRLGISYPAIFSASNIHPKGKYLALFARLNRHGLLEEIEKKQANLSSLNKVYKELNKKIISLNNQISSINTSDIGSIKKFNAEKEILELELYKALPDFKSKIYSIEEISKEIPNNGVLIEYQKYRPFIFDNPADALSEENWEKPRYQALLLLSNGEVETVDLGPAQEIEDLIKKALISSEQYLPDAQKLWNRVGKSIINPLGKYIKDKKVLFISPDAELNKVPFAAVSSANENKLLVEEFLLRLITTGRELVSLNKTNIFNNNKSLVVANPNFNLKDNSSNTKVIKNKKVFEFQKRSFEQSVKVWNSLPETKEEGRFIANRIDGELLIEDKASVLNIQKRNSPKIMHIASHSFFLSDKEEKLALSSILFANSFNKQNSKFEDPLLRSGIVLSGANYPEFNKIDDGYLTALELSKLDLSGTELVVISGCESGLGEIKSGDSIYGLKRSITVAGARSSLLSLWDVNDKATAAFMESFYKKLKEGEGRSEALASTQNEFRVHPNEDWRHPNVWAAFQLSGDWRPISF